MMLLIRRPGNHHPAVVLRHGNTLLVSVAQLAFGTVYGYLPASKLHFYAVRQRYGLFAYT